MPLVPLVAVADGDILELVPVVEVLVVSLVRPGVIVDAVSSDEEEGIGPPGMIALDGVTTVVPTGTETIGVVARETVEPGTEATGTLAMGTANLSFCVQGVRRMKLTSGRSGCNGNNWGSRNWDRSRGNAVGRGYRNRHSDCNTISC